MSRPIEEKLLFEKDHPGRVGASVPPCDVPVADPKAVLGTLARAQAPALLPEMSEVDVVRHFTRLSTYNFAIDLGLYPLGSCTMKYNPKLNEEVARLEGLARIHPLQPAETVQGALELMHTLQQALCAVSGMDACTLQPSAGAQGEFTGMQLIRACLQDRGDARKVVLIPDSAHGTNPATAHFAGYEVEEIKSAPDGCVDLQALKARLRPDVAAIMLTVPNTLGIFEKNIAEVCQLLHDNGSLVYVDGANLNALMGVTRPGDWGADVMHINLHKTFSTPHGGGGPGAGPVVVSETLLPHLPVPRVIRRGEAFHLLWEDPASIGPMRGFYGNFLVLVRALSYIRSLGADGLRSMSETAVLYANLIRHRLRAAYHLKYDTACMHEVVFDDSLQESHEVRNTDIAKRLLDYGFHPPTMSFPIIVHGALMIEPTESAPPEEVEAFCDAMLNIAREVRETPELVRGAPHDAPSRRVDEVRAARTLRVRWRPEE
jgi:glycine dehydrogenase subunit 2